MCVHVHVCNMHVCMCVYACTGVYFAHTYAFISSSFSWDLSFQILDHTGLDFSFGRKTGGRGKPENS